MQQVKPSKEVIIDILVADIQSGIGRAVALAKVIDNWKVSSRTFDRYWKVANERVAEIAAKANKALEEVYTQQAIEQAKLGFKTKQDRIEVLQNQIEACESELELGIVRLTNPHNPDKEIERLMDVYEKVALRRIIKELQAEISKIEGDYASKKILVKEEEPEIDYTKLDSETLMKIASARKMN